MQAVNKHRDNLFQIEAIFFGQAGLLQELPSDDYSAQLTREYAYLAHKFELQPSEHLRWKMLRMRPGNFPHVRIAQLANLYHRSQGMLSQLLLASTVKELRDLLRGGTSLYWLTHYVFGEPSPARPKTLSDASIDLLIINTVIPSSMPTASTKARNGSPNVPATCWSNLNRKTTTSSDCGKNVVCKPPMPATVRHSFNSKELLRHQEMSVLPHRIRIFQEKEG